LPAMLNSWRKKNSRLAGVLGLCLGLLLSTQLLESSHVHADAWDAPDCVQCQLDSSQALPATAPVIHESPVSQTSATPAPESPALAAEYRFNARGPPPISS